MAETLHSNACPLLSRRRMVTTLGKGSLFSLSPHLGGGVPVIRLARLLEPRINMKLFQSRSRSFTARLVSLTIAALTPLAASAEDVTIFHVGDQETWLISAQGNLRNDNSQPISFYGGIDRLAQVIEEAETTAEGTGRFVLKLNAGDALLPGPRFTASLDNLETAHPGDNLQDFYDAIANRAIGFDATVFGNHEFDLGLDLAARFAKVSGTKYLSLNLDFSKHAGLNALEQSGDVAKSLVITTTAGNKIGIIGVTTPLLPTISSPQTLELMEGFAGFDSANTEQENLEAALPFVQAEINGLRTNQGVDVIIVMSHLQNAQNEINTLIPGLSGVDLVISGGGHELMTDADDALINGGVAPTFTTHPTLVNDKDNTPVPMLTGHFGNRYVGEINATINDTTGDFAISSTRMIRVSGQPTDDDDVAGDTDIFNNVVDPVMDFIAALNASIIAVTEVRLNGDRGTAGATPGTYVPGLRNAETNLGNLVADAIRFAGPAEIAIQNAGGIRASINNTGMNPADVSVGDTFNVLPFTNLVKIAKTVNATQLKDILEHGFSGSNNLGVTQGRFPQVSGMTVYFDSTATARQNTNGGDIAAVGTGSRVKKVILNDGDVIIDNGVVVDTQRTFSLATIDFLATGGDGYPFVANNVAFENSVFTITYQDALQEYIETPVEEGGLQRDNGADPTPEITDNAFRVAEAFDLHGRMIDLAVAVEAPGTPVTGDGSANTIDAGPGDDEITGGGGDDTLTGGTGGDVFIYTSKNDAEDIITDFTPHEDTIDLTEFLPKIGYIGGPNAFEDNILKIQDTAGGVNLLFRANGQASGTLETLAKIEGVSVAQLAVGRDFILPEATNPPQPPQQPPVPPNRSPKLSIEVIDVKIEGNEAEATVEFRANDPDGSVRFIEYKIPNVIKRKRTIRADDGTTRITIKDLKVGKRLTLVAKAIDEQGKKSNAETEKIVTRESK